jgi:hypothetical protein
MSAPTMVEQLTPFTGKAIGFTGITVFTTAVATVLLA